VIHVYQNSDKQSCHQLNFKVNDRLINLVVLFQIAKTKLVLKKVKTGKTKLIKKNDVLTTFSLIFVHGHVETKFALS